MLRACAAWSVAKAAWALVCQSMLPSSCLCICPAIPPPPPLFLLTPSRNGKIHRFLFSYFIWLCHVEILRCGAQSEEEPGRRSWADRLLTRAFFFLSLQQSPPPPPPPPPRNTFSPSLRSCLACKDHFRLTCAGMMSTCSAHAHTRSALYTNEAKQSNANRHTRKDASTSNAAQGIFKVQFHGFPHSKTLTTHFPSFHGIVSFPSLSSIFAKSTSCMRLRMTKTLDNREVCQGCMGRGLKAIVPNNNNNGYLEHLTSTDLSTDTFSECTYFQDWMHTTHTHTHTQTSFRLQLR